MMKTIKLNVDITSDPKFFAILPAFNINTHGKITLEFEWLWFGIYIYKANEQIERRRYSRILW